MTKHLACGDVFAGCEATVEAEPEEEVLAQAAEHARAVHGIEEITPELAAQVAGAIRDA